MKPDIDLLHLTLLKSLSIFLQIVVPLLGNGRTFPSHETFSLLVLLAVEIMSHFEERVEAKPYTLQDSRHLFWVSL